MNNSKKGVSLIAVLLFMLVATIAATATFKWLSSSNTSSSSQMMQSEARMAAVSGIENARTWMTYHGNETGAIVKQYLSTKSPVSLDSVLTGFSNSKQNYSVAVVGVDATGSTYRVKVVSRGTSRGGSVHTEAAILKVSGLYRVSIPTTTSSLDFNFNYFGSSSKYEGSSTMDALVINGDWGGNPPKTTGDFVVTGKATLSGSDINVGGTTCIGGDADINNAAISQNFYVKGTISGTAKELSVSQDAYIEGYFSQESKPIDIGGSLTIGNNGHIVTNASATTFEVGADLCIERGGLLEKTNFSSGREIEIPGNVYIPGHNAIYTGKTGSGNYNHVVLGSQTTSKVIIADAHPYSDYVELISTKTFNQESSIKKYCNSKISSDDEWVILNGNGGSDNTKKPSTNYNLCGSWGTPHWENWQSYSGDPEGKHYFAYYTDGWKYWNGASYQPYGAVTSQDHLYYFYNTDGKTDVEFVSDYQLANWKYYTASTNSADNEQEIVLEYVREYDGSHRVFKPGSRQISEKFTQPTPVGVYKVGGELLNDFNGNTNDYNYSNNKSTGSPYCKAKDDDKYQPECFVTPWFKSMVTVTNDTTARTFFCAKHVKDHCDSIWTPTAGGGCAGSNYKVEDQVTTGYNSFVSYANRPACAKSISKLEGNVNALDSCWKHQSEDEDSARVNLYNGYLVVKVAYDQTKDVSGSILNGKFIIIYTNAVGQYTLPSTESDAKVMLYLTEGANGDMLTVPANSNYFIYSLKSIKKLKGSGTMNGSVYIPVSQCYGVQSFDGVKLKLNKKMIDDMAENGLLCDGKSTTCGGAGGVGSGTVSSSTTYSGYDTEYIATAAQLNVEVESQYKNSETFTGTRDVEKSLVVLPRIVYITQDASGTLKDYFTVLPLNGAVANKNNGTVTCPSGGPNGSGPVVTPGDTLASTFYPCTYREGSYSSGFYVVAYGTSGSTPRVSFEGSSSITLNTTETSNNAVNLVVSAVDGSTATNFTVDISVSDEEMNGWTISPTSNVSKISQADGYTIYRYSGSTSSSEQKVNLFTVSTTVGAQTGSARFILQSPNECLVGSPASKTFSITGSTTVKRASLTEYCTKFPGFCDDDSEYSVVMNYEDCEGTGTWVTANGFGCAASVANEEWNCGSGNADGSPIFLEAKNYDASLCTVYIPTDSNRVIGAVDDAVNPDGYYTLYASIKKKMYNVHVLVSGATSNGKVIVKSKARAEDAFEEVGSCNDATDGCDFSFYAGRIVQLSADEGSDKFSYWTCLGGNCERVNEVTTDLQFVMNKNYSYEAMFNETDPHCFATDFSEVSAFCASGSETECIDKCDGTGHCAVNGGRYGTIPDWLMVYGNQGGTNFVKPDFNGGYISYNGSNQSGDQSVIMSRVLAGNNGTLISRIRTENFSPSKEDFFLNNGFVLRSNDNASSYIMLNVYGKEGYGSYARICYGTDQGISSANSCVEKQLKTGSESSPSINPSEAVNVTATLNVDKIDVSVYYTNSKSTASTSFNLSTDWTYGILADANHRYVGFKITDKEFSISDISWKADDFPNEVCFDAPIISCSFAANYMGGIVPLNTEVEPWVGFSSWFNDEDNCTQNVAYYYNGCDVDGSDFVSRGSDLAAACPSTSSQGLYTNEKDPDDGLKISGKYSFNMEGTHGDVGPGGTGLLRNAFVGVTCNSAPFSNPCGKFYVGEKRECTKNEFIVTSPMSGSTTPQTVSIDHNANLRTSQLVFDISSLDANENIEVVLVDVNGFESRPRIVTKAKPELAVDDMSESANFNPEKVVGVRITGSANYTIESLRSSCDNAISIECNGATYNGSSWEVSTTISHGEGATGCRVKPKTSDFPGSDDIFECSNAAFPVLDESFYERLNTSMADTVSYQFEVFIYDEESPNSTTTPAASCVATSNVYHHTEADCSINKETVLQAAGIPTFSYSISNCPDYGCEYTVELSGGSMTPMSKSHSDKIPQDGGSDTWQPDGVNTTQDNKLGENTYTYKVTAWNSGKTKKFAECDTSFNVIAVQEAQGSCSISGSYIIGSITGANYGDPVAVSLVGSDALGNVLDISEIDANDNHSINIDLSTKGLTGGVTYVFSLFVNGTEYDCGSYKEPLKIGLECPANVTNQKADDAVNVTPIVSGCGGVCSWTLTGGSVNTSGTNYDGGQISFTDTDGNGTVSYTIQLSREGAESKSCSFDVNFKGRVLTCSSPNFLPGREHKNLSIYSTVHEEFDIYIDNEKVKEGQWFDANQTKDYGDFTTPSTLGTHTYKVTKKGETSAECSGTFEVVDALTCSIANEVIVGVQNTFIVTKDASVNNCWNCSYTGVDCTNCANGIQNYPFTLTSTTPRKLKISCTCDNVSVSCSQTAVALVVPPTVTCPRPHYSANPNEQITFTPDDLDNCEVGCDYTIVKDGETDPKASKSDHSYKTTSGIPFSGDAAAGETKYIFTVTNTKGSASCDFYVDYKKPTIENCPTSAIDADPGSTITLPSTLTVGNCSSDNCKYSITGGGNTIAGPTTYSSSGTISFTGESAVGEKPYTLTISNGGPTPATCDFEVNYKAVSVSGCSPASKSVEPGESFDVTPTVSHCGGNCWYSFDGGSTHHDYTGGDIPLSTDENGSTTNYTLTFGNNVSGNKGSCDVSVTYLKPEVTCPTTPTISVEPGGRASYDPGVSNCEQGCKYTISKAGSPLPESITEYTYTGGNISFVAGGSADPDTYSLIVTNKADQSATECKFDVGYKVPTFTCPTVSGSKAVGTNITVKPTDVRNCTNGCKYSIEAINGTGTGNTGLESYSSGADLGPVTESSAGTTTYALHLKNDAGYDAENCTFDVTYVTVTCAESDWSISQYNDNTNITGEYTEGCFEFFTDKACKNVQIAAANNTPPGSQGSGTFTVNGTTFTCGQYADKPISQKTTIKLDVSSGCTVKKLYLSGCEDISPRVNSCSVGATMLAADETTTFSASLSNVDSWILKKDGEQVDQGGSTSSISKTITGFGEYKLYLNGETTAKCTKSISEKPAGGVTTDLYCEYYMAQDSWPTHNSGTTIICHNNGWCSAQNLECSGTFKYKVNGGSEQTFSVGSISCQDGSAVTITEGTGKCYLKN